MSRDRAGSGIVDGDVVRALRRAYVAPHADEVRAAVVLDRARGWARSRTTIRRPGYRLARIALCAGALAIVGFVVFSLVPRGAIGPSAGSARVVVEPTAILGRALAAVTPDDAAVVHAIVETRRQTRPLPGLKDPSRYGPWMDEVERTETWVDIRLQQRKTSRRGWIDGKASQRTETVVRDGIATSRRWGVVHSFSASGAAQSQPGSETPVWEERRAGISDQPFSLGESYGDPVTDEGGLGWYRDALAKGRASLAGTETVKGVRAYRLVVSPAAKGLSQRVVYVRTSDYSPLLSESTSTVQSSEGTIGVTTQTVTYEVVERVQQKDVPAGTFDVHIPPDVPIGMTVSLATTGTAARMSAMALAGRFQAFGVWSLGDAIGESKLVGGRVRLQSEPERFPGQLAEVPEYYDGNGYTWPAEDQLAHGAPVLGPVRVEGAYAVKLEAGGRPPAVTASLRVVSFPPLDRSRWSAAARVRPGKDKARSFAVGGRPAELITRTLQAGTARYLLIDCGNATVMVEALGWTEADLLEVAGSLRQLK